jgi:hypothetical protein
MTVQLNHTIVTATDKRESAEFLADILGLPPPKPYGHFLVVEADNDVSLDFADDHGEVHPQHYAFLVSERAVRRDLRADPGAPDPVLRRPRRYTRG